MLWREIGALAGLASSGPSAAVFLHGWPQEALGDELSRCLDSGMAKGMQGIAYLAAERGRDVGAWFSRGSVAVYLDRSTGNEAFFEM